MALATVTNLQSVAIAAGELPGPFAQLALDASGGAADAADVGVNAEDLRAGEDKGAPVYKEINMWIQTGKISVTLASAGTGVTLTGPIDIMDAFDAL